MEIGETDYRVKIAANENKFTNVNQEFSKEKLLTFNTTPASL